MCYPVQCSECGKTTWGGCGAHVASVMARVPQDQRCSCHEQANDKEQNQKKPQGASSFGKAFGKGAS